MDEARHCGLRALIAFAMCASMLNLTTHTECTVFGPEAGGTRSASVVALDQTTRFYGWANDSVTGYGLSGVSVWVENADPDDMYYFNFTYSDTDGTYEMQVPPIQLNITCSMRGYRTWYGEANCTGLDSVRMDVDMVADTEPPTITIEIEPTTSVSQANPLHAHLTAQDPGLWMVGVNILMLVGSDNERKTYIVCDYLGAMWPWDMSGGNLQYVVIDWNFTGDATWYATVRNAGWLVNSSAADFVNSYDVFIWPDEEEFYGISGYYTNAYLTDVSGTAYFDNATGEFAWFEYEDGMEIYAPDPEGMFDPERMGLSIGEEQTVADLLIGFQRLGYRSVSDLVFQYESVAPDGEFAAMSIALDSAWNANYSLRTFYVGSGGLLADAGGDMDTVVNTTTVLDGSGSWDETAIINFTWDIELGGDSLRLYGETGEHVFDTVGVYPVTLTVLDGDGNSDSDTIDVTVWPTEDVPPVADAGEDVEIDMFTSVLLDGSGSYDDRGGIIGYYWTIEEMELEGAMVSHFFPDAGVYHVTLIVTDEAGHASDPDEVVITVHDPTPPTADAGPDIHVNEGDMVLLNASGSSDDTGISECSWWFQDGDLQILNGSTVTYTFERSGNFTVHLTVKDPWGNEGYDTLQVFVNGRPVTDAGADQEVKPGATVQFDGSATTDDGNVTDLEFEWTFRYGDENQALTGRQSSFRFENEGVYEVTLTVTDEGGAVSTDVLKVAVEESTATALWIGAVIAGAAATGVASLLLLKKRKKASSPPQ